MGDQNEVVGGTQMEWRSFQERLRAERERLGLSQEAFAGLGEVGKSSQWLYEQGRHWPTMEYIEALRSRGVDVGYLATGLKLDWESLRHALSFVLRLARQEGRNFSDEQLFGVFRTVIEAASGTTRPDVQPSMSSGAPRIICEGEKK